MFCCRKYNSKRLKNKVVKFPSDGFPTNFENIIEPNNNLRIVNMDKISPVSSDYSSNESDSTTEEIENNRRRVFGERIYNNGDVYRGYWLDGKRHGKGMIIKKNGDSYEGDWENGIRNGYGIERFKNGTVFMGNFVNGVRCGYGEIQMNDKSIYEGTFDDGITGYGKIIWPDGEEYTGDVLDGYKHGYGYTMYDGKKTEGYYEKGHRLL